MEKKLAEWILFYKKRNQTGLTGLTGYFSRLSRDKQNNPENPVDPVQMFLNKIMILYLTRINRDQKVFS